MYHDHSDPACPDNVSTRRSSPHPPSTTSNSNPTVSVIHEEEDLGSSHNSPSVLTSILLPPSENSAARPRSSEGRVKSLNLPNHTLQPSRSHIQSLGTSRRRIIHSASLIRNDEDGHSDEGPNAAIDDGLFNFGLGNELALAPEDPQIKEDVQRVLKAKALRESRSRTEPVMSASETSTAEFSRARLSEDIPTRAQATTRAFRAAPPKPVTSESARPSSSLKSTHTKTTFPSYVPSPAHSLDSVLSHGPLKRSPVPVMMASQDGATYLDWSGAPLAQSTNEKEKSLLGRTFSLTKRRSKGGNGIANMTGRNSLDFRASQGELHAATLDSIRHTARRDTLSRAEKTKDELTRRYAFLSSRTSTGEPELDILDVVKSREDHTSIQTPWLAWCRRLLLSRLKISIWTITADSIEEYFQAVGRHSSRPSVVHSTPTSMSVTQSQSPAFGFSLPLSSPHPSLSTSPLSNNGERDRDREHIEPSLPLSVNPVAEGVLAPPSLLPTLRPSPDLAHAASVGNTATPLVEQRHSVGIVKPENVNFTNLNHSPRNSLDRGLDQQPLSNFSNAERASLTRTLPELLAADKTKPLMESRSSTVSSITNLLGVAPSSQAPLTGARLHLGVGNMFGRKRHRGDETPCETGPSRSSVSDERDSAKEGEGTKSDDATRFRGLTFAAPGLDIRGLMSRGKEAFNASDSEPGGASGLLTAKIGRTFLRSDKDRPKDRSMEDVTAHFPREAASGGEHWQVDAVAAPGWSSRRGVRRARMSASNEMERDKLQQILQKHAEEEEREKAIYKARELLLVEANDHNRRIARLLKIICSSIREHEDVRSELARAVGLQHSAIPLEVLDAICADPAITLRHGKGCQAVENSHRRFHSQQAVLMSYLSILMTTAEQVASSDLGNDICEAEDLWQNLRVKLVQIEKQAMMTTPVIDRAVRHMRDVQNEYNATQMLVETDYQESRLMDLETIITESRAPRGWLEFAAVWIPEHVLEFIGGFIRFFGVPISEKFIRPFLWYFFRHRYYWKIYSTEPPPSQRAWYTRLSYWVVILSILAWYSTV